MTSKRNNKYLMKIDIRKFYEPLSWHPAEFMPFDIASKLTFDSKPLKKKSPHIKPIPPLTAKELNGMTAALLAQIQHDKK